MLVTNKEIILHVYLFVLLVQISIKIFRKDANFIKNFISFKNFTDNTDTLILYIVSNNL